jgi:DNA-binding PadR family transcriptional regulator
VTTATLTIGREERDVLHGLMCRRLFILGMEPVELAHKEGASVEEVAEGFGEDLRLMQDIGWEFEGTSSSVELTMPAESLARALMRLRRDARRAPSEARHEREPEESDEERWQRFGRGAKVCSELLKRLASAQADENPQPTEVASAVEMASEELGAYIPVSDAFILAATERAERHEQADDVWVVYLTEHLGFKACPDTNRSLLPRLEAMHRAGLLTSRERRGEPYFGLTTVGREQLASHREAGDVGELPESPQHRAWRLARVKAALRIDEFQREQVAALEEADRLICKYRPTTLSKDWFELSERLRWTTWRFGSALYCLTEWVEPDDDLPDVDESPGPRPGRRRTAAWDQCCTRSEGSA